MVEYENEVCQYLGIPSIPKKKWDRKSSFKRGVGIVDLIGGHQAYVVVTFDAEHDIDCRIVKVFTLEQFILGGFGLSEVFVVPDYMDTDVENMDLDESSKEAAKALVNEALDLENADTASSKVTFPENEYYFDNVHSDEEGMAFIKAHNTSNRIKGKIPTTHEGIVMRLSVIYSELNNKSNKSSTSKRKRK